MKLEVWTAVLRTSLSCFIVTDRMPSRFEPICCNKGSQLSFHYLLKCHLDGLAHNTQVTSPLGLESGSHCLVGCGDTHNP